jgi:hypothetical protein
MYEEKGEDSSERWHCEKNRQSRLGHIDATCNRKFDELIPSLPPRGEPNIALCGTIILFGQYEKLVTCLKGTYKIMPSKYLFSQ